MNVTDLKTALGRYGFDSNDPLLLWLNNAYHEIEDDFHWPWLEEKATVNAAAGVDTLVSPSDIFKVESLKIVGGDKLQFMERTEFDREVEDQTVQGTPDTYVLTDLTTIQVYPVPDVATTFSLVYRKQLADMVDGGTPDMPATLHYAIVLGAAKTALQAENEEERAKTAQDEFAERLARAKNRYASPTSDEPDQVVDVMGYT